MSLIVERGDAELAFDGGQGAVFDCLVILTDAIATDFDAVEEEADSCQVQHVCNETEYVHVFLFWERFNNYYKVGVRFDRK
jgi:hypothetical protein